MLRRVNRVPGLHVLPRNMLWPAQSILLDNARHLLWRGTETHDPLALSPGGSPPHSHSGASGRLQVGLKNEAVALLAGRVRLSHHIKHGFLGRHVFDSGAKAGLDVISPRPSLPHLDQLVLVQSLRLRDLKVIFTLIDSVNLQNLLRCTAASIASLAFLGQETRGIGRATDDAICDTQDFVLMRKQRVRLVQAILNVSIQSRGVADSLQLRRSER
mmetsp:Transcript_7321/g.13495  ORF Transcript_7321/g.13495 Transcript_7321/m.13495 type:complete len:215 (-) Transcript_7321:274-918(-)